ncbi:FAD-binding domain-containing protein [Mycena venus]|uniref:FAD-binding domain-containing protein n=1 Tax=Mycena venus TaxID=2733690 RepID=A0A8H6X8G1_9AGAR|nr:FAD-binding domain-containing protein [Mycena venus]
MRNSSPEGCRAGAVSPKSAVTIGAGVSFSELTDFSEVNNLTIPSGGDLSVGAAGGYPQAGGHGILSNVHGLAADRVLQYEVVTPRGDHLLANECQNTDLFFALRGGGGGTFGVVLKMTTLVFPAAPINAVFAAFNSSVPGHRLDFVRFVTDISLGLANQGWGTYIIPAAGILLANPILTPAEANASMNALRTFVTSNLTGSFTMTVEPNYKTFFNNYIGALIHVPVGIPLTISSRLIPAENFKTESGRTSLADALDKVVDEVDIAIAFATTPFLHGDKNQTSVSPAWYQSLWHVALGNTWNFNTSESDVAKKYSDLTAAADPFRQLAPTSGAYQNEADVYEPNHEGCILLGSTLSASALNQEEIVESYDIGADKELTGIKPVTRNIYWIAGSVVSAFGWLGANNSRYKCYI